MFRNFNYKVLILLLLVAFSCGKADKTAYVLMPVLYKEFQGTKEFREELEIKQQKQQFVLDSLNLLIKELQEQNPSSEKLYEVRNYFNAALKEFEEDNYLTEQQFSQSAWKHINKYVRKYGESNGYTYILGADGTGSLMYADTTRDITRPVIDYINKQYQDE